MARITLAGPALEGFDPGLPAASVRFLLPGHTNEVALPTWNGNEFLLEDGSRPIIRTLTPLRFQPGPLELDVEIGPPRARTPLRMGGRGQGRRSRGGRRYGAFRSTGCAGAR